MRYILALGVLIDHFNILCDADIPWVISSYNSVGVFFAISGFVLIGRLLKGFPFSKYATNRAWRIFPSYFFIVLFVALTFSIFSNLSFGSYFSSTGFWKYLAANLTFLNFLHPELPGFDTHSIANAVNGSLWTMKIEIQLSLIAPFFVWICKKYKLNIIKSITFIIGISIFYRFLFEYLYSIYTHPIFEILGRQFIGQLLYFFAGILIYIFYDFFIKNIRLFILFSLALYIVTWEWIEIPYYHLWLQPFVVTSLVMGLALLPYNLSATLGLKYNFSYELYLCHYPMIILVKHFDLPTNAGITMSFIISIVSSVLLALITYFSVGRLYLKNKNIR